MSHCSIAPASARCQGSLRRRRKLRLRRCRHRRGAPAQVGGVVAPPVLATVTAAADPRVFLYQSDSDEAASVNETANPAAFRAGNSGACGVGGSQRSWRPIGRGSRRGSGNEVTQGLCGVPFAESSPYGAFCRNSGALMRNWGVKTRGLICRGCTSSNTPSGRQWRLTRPEFAADAASVTAREQNCPVSPAGEQLGDRWYVAATKSGFQFTKRSNWSTVNARTPNIRWHSTLLWPRTRTCRAPNSSFSRPLTRSTVDRSR